MREKILFIDDEIFKFPFLKEKLKNNYDILFETDPENALKIVQNKKNDFGLVISDVCMPIMNGIELLENIHLINPDIVCVLVTGNPDLDSAINALNKVNTFQYLVKPFKYEILKNTIESGMEKYKETIELKNKSIRDSLTKLYNHMNIINMLEKEIETTKRYNDRLSILFLDLDNFKHINDTFGHRFGDEVLVKISKSIKSNIRIIDSAGRYGGEEFLIILPKSGLLESWFIAERIRKSIENIIWSKEEVKITVSGGLAEYNGEDLNSFIINADNLLYKAKHSGKNIIEM